MVVSYNKLWKLLIDKRINKTHLKEETGISSATIARLGREQTVSLDVLIKICHVLECDIGDILEVLPPQKDK